MTMSYPGFLEKKFFLVEFAVSRRLLGALIRQTPHPFFVLMGRRSRPINTKKMFYCDEGARRAPSSQ